MKRQRNNENPILAWFLKTLERMAASHGARVLAQPHLQQAMLSAKEEF
jgi:hypothetical protein